MDETWVRSVGEALAAGDEARLRALFRDAVDAIGPERASQAWLSAASGFDSSAQTG